MRRSRVQVPSSAVIIMITTQTLKIEYTNDDEKIENALKALGIEPLRWAVVGIYDNEMDISVSYVPKDYIQADDLK